MASRMPRVCPGGFVLFMALRRQSQVVIKHRDCQPAEGAEPRSWTALDAGRAGVRALASRKLCPVMGLGPWCRSAGYLRVNYGRGQRMMFLPSGTRLESAWGVGVRLEGFGRSQLLHCSLFDIGQLDRAL